MFERILSLLINATSSNFRLVSDVLYASQDYNANFREMPSEISGWCEIQELCYFCIKNSYFQNITVLDNKRIIGKPLNGKKKVPNRYSSYYSQKYWYFERSNVISFTHNFIQNSNTQPISSLSLASAVTLKRVILPASNSSSEKYCRDRRHIMQTNGSRAHVPEGLLSQWIQSNLAKRRIAPSPPPCHSHSGHLTTPRVASLI